MIFGKRMKTAFVSKVTFYDDEDSHEENEAAEMISPLLNSHGEVIAVLQLLKTSTSAQFKKEDLRYSALVSTLICDNLPTIRADESLDWSLVSVVTLTENGYGQKLTIEPDERSRLLTKAKSDRRATLIR